MTRLGMPSYSAHREEEEAAETVSYVSVFSFSFSFFFLTYFGFYLNDPLSCRREQSRSPTRMAEESESSERPQLFFCLFACLFRRNGRTEEISCCKKLRKENSKIQLLFHQ